MRRRSARTEVARWLGPTLIAIAIILGGPVEAPSRDARSAIARALMNKPQVLLADEPTGNLDVYTGGEILDLIAEQHRDGLMVVMVTHDQSIAERADRVVHLHDGRVEG